MTVYLTTAELAELEAKAREVDRQLAVYACEAVLKGKVAPCRDLGNDRLLAALTRIGVNLNQLTRHVNRNRRISAGTADRLNAVLSRIDALTEPASVDGA